MSNVKETFHEADRLKDEGKLEEAIAKFNEVIALDPQHVLSQLALAVLYGKVNQHEKAIEHGQRACELEPNDAFNFTAMSVTYQRAWAGTQNQQYIQAAEDAMAKAQELQGRG